MGNRLDGIWLALVIGMYTMRNRCQACMISLRHLICHCKCCKYCDVCKQCGCRFKCVHIQSLMSDKDSDMEEGRMASSDSSSADSASYIDETLKKNGKNEQHILESQLEQKTRELEHAKAECNKCNLQIRDLKKRLDEVTHKLSAEMSSKVSSNESAVENVNIKNRPMNVAEEYQLMCSNEWLDAKTAIDDCITEGQDVPEYTRITLLREMIMVTEATIKREFMAIQSQVESLLSTMFDPLKDKTQTQVSVVEKTHSRNPAGNTLAVTNSIGDFMRVHADTISYNHIVEVLYTSIDAHLTEPSLSQVFSLWNACRHCDNIHKYIHKTANIVWKMTLQRPPMAFKFTKNFEGEKYQDLHWSSVQIPNPVVFEVYPILYHGSSIMAKGKVYLVNPGDLRLY